VRDGAATEGLAFDQAEVERLGQLREQRQSAPDHPRAELLKYKGLICRLPAIPAGLLHRPELARWLLAHAKATAPLVIWCRRNLG
jgi:hypothetical protein